MGDLFQLINLAGTILFASMGWDVSELVGSELEVKGFSNHGIAAPVAVSREVTAANWNGAGKFAEGPLCRIVYPVAVK